MSSPVLAELEAEQDKAKSKWHHVTVILLVIAAAMFCLMLIGQGYVMYQIYSCTNPNGQCRQEGEVRTNEFLAKLDARHQDIQDDIAELRQLIIEQESTP